jgi:pimeloyl-ACP methyl ester carboxylesterase
VEHDGRSNEVTLAISKSSARVAGVEIEYVRFAGRSDAPTLVFLHEGLGSVDAWRDFPERLCAQTGCPGLVYSRYGNGFSSVLRGARAISYMHDEALQTLPALLDQLSIDSTILVGHSDGASIAILYGAEYPAKVRAIVLEAPHVFVEELSVRSIAAIRGDFENGDLPARLARYHADAAKTFYGWNDIWLSPEFRAWNIEPAVDRLAAPVLVVQGRDDRYGTVAQVQSIVDRHADTDSLLLSACGHAPHRERGALVTGVVARWVAERSG